MVGGNLMPKHPINRPRNSPRPYPVAPPEVLAHGLVITAWSDGAYRVTHPRSHHKIETLPTHRQATLCHTHHVHLDPHPKCPPAHPGSTPH